MSGVIGSFVHLGTFLTLLQVQVMLVGAYIVSILFLEVLMVCVLHCMLICPLQVFGMLEK